MNLPPDAMTGRILYVVNEPAFFVSHRLRLAQAARHAGYQVLVATGPGEGERDIIAAGFSHRRLPLSRSGTNPLRELYLLVRMAVLFLSFRPDLVHLVTIKPVLYGGTLARLLRVPSVVAAVSGMGHLFGPERDGFARTLAERLYRLAFGNPRCRVIVQNDTDAADLRQMGALRAGQEILIPGSGVDLTRFRVTPLPEGEPVVVLPARMLTEKGVRVFVEAAALLKARETSARLVLVGGHDPDNRSAVPLAELEAWRRHGPAEWWGRRADMPQVLAAASLVVLPSLYREGMPKSLLEAAAAGRAIVTTDVPGCRDAVEAGVTGELVPAGDARALADAIAGLLSDRERLRAMGRAARRKAEAEFGVERVVAAHMELYAQLMQNSTKQSSRR